MSQKRIYGPCVHCRLLNDFLSNLGGMRRAKNRISGAFQERIMLAVTQVNGCRMCSYRHTNEALKKGVDLAQIESILEGDLAAAPDGELTALVFAQHYADTIGRYDPDAWNRVVDTYGDDTADAILCFIRVIMMGNAQGNTVAAIRSRFKGEPEPGSSFLKELSVLLLDLVVLPLLLMKAAILGIARGIVSLFGKHGQGG